MTEKPLKKRHDAGLIRFNLPQIEEWAKQGYTRSQIYENLKLKGAVITYSSFLTTLKRARKKAAENPPVSGMTGEVKTTFATRERNSFPPNAESSPPPAPPTETGKLDLRAVLRGEVTDIEDTPRPSIRRDKK